MSHQLEPCVHTDRPWGAASGRPFGPTVVQKMPIVRTVAIEGSASDHGKTESAAGHASH